MIKWNIQDLVLFFRTFLSLSELCFTSTSMQQNSFLFSSLHKRDQPDIRQVYRSKRSYTKIIDLCRRHPITYTSCIFWVLLKYSKRTSYVLFGTKESPTCTCQKKEKISLAQEIFYSLLFELTEPSLEEFLSKHYLYSFFHLFSSFPKDFSGIVQLLPEILWIIFHNCYTILHCYSRWVASSLARIVFLFSSLLSFLPLGAGVGWWWWEQVGVTESFSVTVIFCN